MIANNYNQRLFLYDSSRIYTFISEESILKLSQLSSSKTIVKFQSLSDECGDLQLYSSSKSEEKCQSLSNELEDHTLNSSSKIIKKCQSSNDEHEQELNSFSTSSL